MPRRDRAALLPWVGVGVSVLCVGAVIWWAARQPAPRLPTKPAEIGWLVLSISLYALATLIRGERWRLLIADQGGSMSRADSVGLMVVGYMGNNVLPARGGDLFRVILGAPRAAVGRRSILGTLLAERLLDIVVLAVIFVVLAITIAGGAGLPSGDSLRWLLIAAAAALTALALTFVVLARRGLIRRARKFLAPMFASTFALRGAHGAVMLALTLAVWLIEAGVWGTAGAAAGFEMNGPEAMYMVALASMFALIPSGPGYAGTQDAAAVIGAKAIGATSQTAVSYLVLVRFVLLVPITLAGLLLVAVRYGGLRRVFRRG
ncbi:MAG TPA: lysylphosphatidylglycerol synthase transmembrane domain-containing protein [Baekduia sp.]|nr:lysylphosphatidylglycerol synthase transmembrane domain-containing protein [Baekduia sp.]